MHQEEVRLARLEQEQARIQQRLDDGERRFDELLGAISKNNAETILLRDAITSLRTTIEESRKHECPDPGACSRLERRMDSVEDNIGVLKADKAEVMGGWKALAILGGAFATMVGIAAGVVAVIRHFVKG